MRATSAMMRERRVELAGPHGEAELGAVPAGAARRARRRAPRPRGRSASAERVARALGHHRGGRAPRCRRGRRDRRPSRRRATSEAVTSGKRAVRHGDHGEAVGEPLHVRRRHGGHDLRARRRRRDPLGLGRRLRRSRISAGAASAAACDRRGGGDRVLARRRSALPRADSGPRALASSRSQRRATRWMSAGVTAAISREPPVGGARRRRRRSPPRRAPRRGPRRSRGRAARRSAVRSSPRRARRR